MTGDLKCMCSQVKMGLSYNTFENTFFYSKNILFSELNKWVAIPDLMKCLKWCMVFLG